MGEAGLLSEDGRLADELAARLEPRLQDALNHRTRREILRFLHAEERPGGVTEFLVSLPSLRREEITYHARVLEKSGCIEVEGNGVAPGERLFRSNLQANDKALLVLRATEDSDQGHRGAAAEDHPDAVTTMFRPPRPSRTVRLLNRRRRETE